MSAWRRGCGLGLLALCGLCASLPTAAALPEALQKLRPSVVAIGTYQRTRSPAFVFRGSGFAVGDGRSVATNAHVLPTALDEERMEQLAVAIPDPAGGAQIRAASRQRSDGEHDLALLRIEGDALPAAVLSAGGMLREGEEIGFTGFPIGSALGLTPVTHRGVVSAITPIGIPQANARQLDPRLLKRLADGAFLVYQLDATAYPGSSGSALFDTASGEVVGVVNMVFVKGTKENTLSDPSGITYAIPVRYLRELLERR